MTEEKGFIWAGIDVSKRTFFAAIDIENEAEKLPVAKLPAKEFKRSSTVESTNSSFFARAVPGARTTPFPIAGT